MDRQNQWDCEVFSPEAVLIFPKNFLNFGPDMIEKQSIINLCNYSSKSYASEFSDFEVAFQWEGKNATFYPFLYCLVLWHINHCRLFNAKPSLYIIIKYMICKHFVDNIFMVWFGGFYGISTFVGYLIQFSLA